MQMQPSDVADDMKRQSLRTRPRRLSVTIEDACDMTGLGRTKVYELIAEGRLKSVTVGRRRLVMYASIEALLSQAA